MRIGVVQGVLTASRKDPGLPGGRLVWCAIRTPADLAAPTPAGHAPRASGDWIVVFDTLGAGLGDQVAISEGVEATQPFKPARVPIDAYVAALLDRVVVAR